ncbi:multidrug effflux MFS transporter [Nocardioides sp. T2.26MG-1]|uniref:multidrug effflux MFS transporter n=1 Tax=Nocardioides sp. T2.26MG-1 TaxID=3041166 RepID=UPI0024777593|nr:multidrug effflux MFS transporter [Nocardioides sp. T2.26MG-1]CAI9419434.1 Bicyclomycin resistance protein [Nocardioides sp. T2.26MG-1]
MRTTADGCGTGASATPGVVRPAPPRESLRLVLMLGVLVALGPFTIDMYLPALPTITDELQTTSTAVQLTLTGTLAGLGLGQLVLGPLSDTFGRRRPLLAGTTVHVVASLLCAVAPNVGVLGALRVLEGLGAAAASVVAIAVVRDLFSGVRAARMISRLVLVIGASPVLAPTVGGEVLRWTDWRGVFAALAVLGLAVTVMAAIALPETLPPARRRTGGVPATLRTYAGLLTDRTFVCLVLVSGLNASALFAYVAGSSFVMQDQYGLSEHTFSLIFAVNSVANIGASQVNVVLLTWFEPARILVASLSTAVVASLALLVVAVTGAGGVLGLLVPLFVLLGAIGQSGPNASALGLSLHGESAGTAAALFGSLNFGLGALAAPVVGMLGNDSHAMAAVMAGSIGLAATVLVLGVRLRVLHAIDLSDPEPVALPAAG